MGMGTRSVIYLNDLSKMVYHLTENVAQTGANVKGVSMTLDGNSGQWGCIIKYSEAAVDVGC